MATLNRKRTASNITVWSAYIEEQSDWTKWKDVLFVETGKVGGTVQLTDKNGTPIKNAISLKNKDKLTLLSNKSVSLKQQKLIYVSHKNQRGYLPISKVGYPAKNTTLQEDKSLQILDDYIKTAMNDRCQHNL